MQEASGAGERVQSLVERGIPYATERAQFTERQWTAGRLECGGDAFIDGDWGGDRFVRSLEYTERKAGPVLLEFKCEGGR